MGAGDYFLLAYTVIGWGLNISNGRYAVSAYILMACALVLLTTGTIVWQMGKGSERTIPSSSTLLISLLSFLFLNLTASSSGLYVEWEAFERHFWTTNVVLLLLVPILYTPARFPARLRSSLCWSIVAVAFTFRLLLPFASPAPNIDVFSMSQQSSQHLLSGRNPYLVHIRDVYEGMGQLGYVIKHYTYPPASLYPQVAVYAVARDVRYAFVLAEAIFLFILWRLVRSRWPSPHVELLLLLFLFHPRGIFILEQSWIEPLLLASFALFVFLWSTARKTAALLTYGFFLALKQYTVFFILPFLLILERRLSRLSTVALMGFLTLLPFAVWHWRSLWEQGLLFQLLAPFRDDSLSLGTLLLPWMGELGMQWSGIPAVIVMIGSSVLLRRQGMRGFLQACTLTLASILVLGSWAFANYYYFLSGLILLTAASLGRSETAMARGRSPGP